MVVGLLERGMAMLNQLQNICVAMNDKPVYTGVAGVVSIMLSLWQKKGIYNEKGSR